MENKLLSFIMNSYLFILIMDEILRFLQYERQFYITFKNPYSVFIIGIARIGFYSHIILVNFAYMRLMSCPLHR